MNVSFLPLHRSRCLLIALITLLLCLPGSARKAQAAPAAARLSGHIPTAAIARAHPMGRVAAGQPISLLLALPLRNSAGLSDFLSRLYDPIDPQYHHFITAEEFANRYSPTQQSYDAVAAFARSRGLKVLHTTPNRLLLSVSGPASAVESAFSVHLRRYAASDGRIFHAPDANPAVPTALVGRLSGVIGLQTASLPRPLLRRSSFQPRATLKAARKPFLLKPVGGFSLSPTDIGTDPNTGALQPSDIKAAYNLNQTSLNGAGQIMGLFELDGYLPSDIVGYNSSFGLSNIPLENILIDGFDGSAGPDAIEVTLDIQVMNAVAPGASKILVYEAPNSILGFVDLFNKIATDNRAKEISVSWGISENAETRADQDTENAAFMQMASQGQSVFVASGDSGAYTDGATLSVSDPASQPYVVSVGGTTLSVVRPGGAYRTESAWGDPTPDQRSDKGSGGGGGISDVWPLPDYQVGIGQSSTQRNVPDVSLDADPNTGYALYYQGQWGVVGGTSVAAPIWAAFTALANQQRVKYGQPLIGFPNPLIYQIGKSANYSTAFHDISDGSTNLFYPATPGYDNATGWGSFNGVNLLALFAPAPSATGNAVASLTLTPNPVVGGLTVTGTVTLTNPAPAAGATVALSTTDAGTAPVPATVVVPAGQTSADFTIVTTSLTAATTVTIKASYAGGSQSAGLIVQPPPDVAFPSSLALVPSSVKGGDSSTATLLLTGPAPIRGLTVTLSSSDPAAQVPATVTVPPRSVSVTFPVTTTPVLKQVDAVITASVNGASTTATLTVLAPTLQKILLTPPIVAGGQTSIGTLSLTFAAPAGGAVVALISDNPAAVVPATVTIPAGELTTTFTITTNPVPKDVVAVIKATYADLDQIVKLEIDAARITTVTVAPASVTGGTSSVGTVTLDSPVAVASGLVVTLASSDPAGTVPASVTVAKGSTTATFPIATTVVPAPVADTITATLDSISKTTTLSVQPIQATNLTLTPAQVTLGATSTGKITVNAPAPAGGLTVTLSSTGGTPSSPVATVPTTVVIPSGQNSVTFPITTNSAGTAVLFAVAGGQTRSATLTVTTAAGTTFPAGLSLISVPYDYSGQALDTVFGYSGVRLATYQTSLSRYAYTPEAPADTMRPGRGFFVRLPKALTLARVGTPVDPTKDFSIPLSTGWNMIGDPFLVPIKLGSVRFQSGATTSTFADATTASPLLVSELVYSYSQTAASGQAAYVFNRGDAALLPGQGYWIYAYQPSTLIFPHPGQ